MEIIPIFVSDHPGNGDRLYAMRYEQTEMNEYTRILQYWRDREALFNFFSSNINDLENGFWDNMTIAAPLS
jgi:hypothetical protein